MYVDIPSISRRQRIPRLCSITQDKVKDEGEDEDAEGETDHEYEREGKAKKTADTTVKVDYPKARLSYSEREASSDLLSEILGI